MPWWIWHLTHVSSIMHYNWYLFKTIFDTNFVATLPKSYAFSDYAICIASVFLQQPSSCGSPPIRSTECQGCWCLLYQVKMQYLHFRFHAKYFLLPWNIPEKLADDQCSSITKGSIYHIKRMYIHPFTTVVDWSEMWHLMEVSTMFYICRYRGFSWYGRHGSVAFVWHYS